MADGISEPIVESDPMAELAKQNAKYIKNCTELHLADRRIQRLAGFEAFVNLEVLWLNNNRLHKLEDLDTNVRIRELYVHNNRLHSLRGSLQKFKFLNVLNVSNNKLHGLQAALDVLTGFQYLHHLELFGNPLSEETDYRLHVLKRLPWLEVFDRHPVTEDELDAAKWLGTAKERRVDLVAESKPYVPELSGTTKVLLHEVAMCRADAERAREAQRLALCQGVSTEGVDASAAPPCAYSKAAPPPPGGSELTPWEWSHFLSLCRAQAAAGGGTGAGPGENGVAGDGAGGGAGGGGALVTQEQILAAIVDMRYFGRCLEGGGTHDAPVGPQQETVEALFEALVAATAAQAASGNDKADKGKGGGAEPVQGAAKRVSANDFWRLASGAGFAAPEEGCVSGVAPRVLRWACMGSEELEELVEDLFEEADQLQRGAMELEPSDPRFKERQVRAADAAQKANRLAKQLEERKE